MGLLVNGVWNNAWYDTSKSGGEFIRTESQFRNRVGADGDGGYHAEAGRYHLYVSLACPWAHRALILRSLKGLEQAIAVSIVDPFVEENGWEFTGRERGTLDRIGGARYLYEVYLRAQPGYSGRVTVPVLWDTHRGTIVNNESSEIIRMLNSEFDAYATKTLPDLYPEPQRQQIERWNDVIYLTVNNGVYQAGFATTQQSYDRAVRELFASLELIDQHLARHRYLCGKNITEADFRLFTTLVRFDAVYYGHFKCNLKRLVDYVNLWDYTREIYQIPAVAATVDLAQIKEHYYRSHATINPSRIVPAGPLIDFDQPHGREILG